MMPMRYVSFRLAAWILVGLVICAGLRHSVQNMLKYGVFNWGSKRYHFRALLYYEPLKKFYRIADVREGPPFTKIYTGLDLIVPSKDYYEATKIIIKFESDMKKCFTMEFRPVSMAYVLWMDDSGERINNIQWSRIDIAKPHKTLMRQLEAARRQLVLEYRSKGIWIT